MTYKVTHDDAAWTGDAFDAEDAAAVAVEHWYEHGMWAGEEMPDRVETVVTCNDGPPDRVTVRVDWSISCTGWLEPSR